MNSFPLYILQLGDKRHIIFPGDKQDISHSDFWEQTGSFVVAQHYKLPQGKLVNLPYCQRRGRIVGEKFYCGEKDGSDILRLVRQVLGDDDLVLYFDEHERRLREDVRAFRRLLRRSPQA